MASFSIIIPTWNRADMLHPALESLLAQDHGGLEHEILVVDNGSTDATQDVVRQLAAAHPGRALRAVLEPVPGLVAGRHRGAREARGDVLCFLDDDILADPGWLRSVAEVFALPGTALAGGPCLPAFDVPPPPWLPWLWSEIPDGGTACGYLSLMDLGRAVRPVDPWMVWGLNYCIRSEALAACGGFHPDCMPPALQRYQGDGETGLSRKLKDSGRAAVYHPGALVHHRVPASRLTLDYFERREFYQGVADSYNRIRERGGLEGVSGPRPGDRTPQALRPLPWRTALRRPWRLPRVLADRLRPCPVPRELLARMEKGYADGFAFHQREAAADPALLAWILKPDYFDYALPPRADGAGA